MKLPKLYRRVWLKIEWLKDECVNGEHEQTDGYIYIEARRVKRVDNSWFWKMDQWDIEESRYELEMSGYFEFEEDFYYDVLYKNPYPFKGRDWCYSYKRMTIKEQLDQKAYMKELDEMPF